MIRGTPPSGFESIVEITLFRPEAASPKCMMWACPESVSLSSPGANDDTPDPFARPPWRVEVIESDRPRLPFLPDILHKILLM